MENTIQDFHDDLAEALQNQTAMAENLPPRKRRAFMIHECFDGSGMREKLPA